MTEVRTFSPWCQMCLDGEDKGRIGAHELHVLRLKRERAKRPSKLHWQLVDIVKPLPRGSGQGPRLTLADQVDQQTQPAEHINSQTDHASSDQKI